MKLLVFGPTGDTGRQIVSQALAFGHPASAFCRNPAAIEASADLFMLRELENPAWLHRRPVLVG